MVSPVPVEIVAAMNPSVNYIVAINTSSPLLSMEHLNTPIDIAGQVTSIMTRDKLIAELNRADYVIAPVPDSITSVEFDIRDSIIEIGYRAGLRAADSIIAYMSASAISRPFTINDVTCRDCSESLRARLIGSRLTRAELTRLLSGELLDHSLYRIAARFTPAHAADNADSSTINLTITTERSLATSHLNISFRGVTRYADSTLIKAMALQQGNLTAPALKRALDRIVNLYIVDGYELTDIRDVVVDTAATTLTISVDEAIVRRIDVENNVKARDWLVRSYCPLKVGQPYSTRAASRGVSNIYGTDLFEQVSIEPIPLADGVAAVISVHEKHSTQVRLGWHWDDEYQSEEFGELLDDDVMGAGVEYALHAQYGNDHQLYSGDLKANRIFSTYLTARFEVYHDRFNRNLFGGAEHPISERDEITNGSCLTVGQQIVRLGTVSTKLKIRDITSRDPKSEFEEKLRLRQVIFESHVETFDRWPFPRTGKRNFIELAFAGKYLGGTTEFTRFFTSLESYFPFGRWLCYHPTLSVGLSRSGLPITEQFYIGGQHSFAGLRTNQAAGDKLLMLNQELRVKLPLRLYFTSRLDIGEVYATAEQIKLRNLRTGFGVSLAVDSPIGPIEFGYGLTNHRADRFYFSAGPSF
jgi:NTE family protein